MINTTLAAELTSPSTPSCSPDGKTGDCSESTVESWFESKVIGDFRVWQLCAIVLSILLALIFGACRYNKFRIPRTKQEIEADYIRKRITKNFHKELAKIDNADMDEMDLKKALERVRDGLEVESEEMQKTQGPVQAVKSTEGIGERFQAMVHGIRIRFAKDSPPIPKSKIQEPSDSEA